LTFRDDVYYESLGKNEMNTLWQPDLYIEKLIDFQVMEVLQPLRVFLIYEDGIVYHKVTSKATVGCAMNFQKFPMDTQHCQFIVCKIIAFSLYKKDISIVMACSSSLDDSSPSARHVFGLGI
jgi:hypothetical protein